MRGQLLLIILAVISLNAIAQVPAITSFSPASGAVGSEVVIKGSNFNSTALGNIVFFGATKATVKAATANQLTVMVPVGASYQPISLVNTATHLIAYSNLPFVATFTSKHAIEQTDFDLPQAFATGNGPVQIAEADLDGDGKIDVVSVNRDKGTVGIYINTSTNTGSISSGQFLLQNTLTDSGDPVGVVIGDVNGDGLPDLIIKNDLSPTISVCINASTPGTFTFQPPVDYTLGIDGSATAVSNIAIADIDGDGKPDIVVTTNGYYFKTISVLRNSSVNSNATTFEPEVYFYGGDNITSLNITDLDGDGLPDLVLTTNDLAIMHNLSSPGVIKFADKTDILTNGTPVTANIGDLDNDGKPDIVLANPNPYADPFHSTISIYRNTSSTGNISLASVVNFPSGAITYSMAIGDLDGDGLPDVAINSGQNIQLFRNITTGNAITLDAAVTIADLDPTAIVVGDLNGDGKPDLAVADFATNSFKVFENDPQPTAVNLPPLVGSFSPKTGPIGTPVVISGKNFNANAANNTVYFGATKATITAASATQLTVTVPVGATNQPLSVLNTSTKLAGYSASPFITTFADDKRLINFDPKVDFATGEGPTAIAVADIDGDGKPDVIILNRHGNSVTIYRNTSANGSISQASFAPGIDFATPLAPTSVAIGDLNADGKLDIVIGCNDGNNISILRNSSTVGNISMAPLLNFAQNSPVNAVGVADIDGDGKPDIVAVINDNSVSVYRNQSAGGTIDVSFVKENLNLTTDTGPGQLSITDLDGDGKPDLVVTVMGAFSTPGSLAIFRNTSTSGKASFVPVVYPNAGDWPQAIAVSDVNGDGKPDVLVSLIGPYNTNQISVLPNTSTAGNITFGTPVALQGNGTRSIGIADMNGDGNPDVVSVLQDTNQAVVLANNSTSSGVAFKPGTNFATGNYPQAVDIADLDGDGKPDLIVANALGNTFSILRFNTDGFAAPSISTLSPVLGKAGSYIAINGLNLTGATAVSFGGTSAASFTVNSPTQITAVLANGASGDVTVTTPNGNASLSGFVFVPVPTITVAGPTTFETGGSVLLTANPAGTLYNYQWLKDGVYISGALSPTFTATESGTYSIILSYFTASETSVQTVSVDVNFALPQSNFTLLATSATCKGSGNGSINVTAAQAMNYTATISGNGINTISAFTTSTNFDNLTAGNYNVCITVAGATSYQQCFGIIITEPKDLSLYSTINDADNSITLTLGGGNSYNIQLNNTSYITTDNSITLPLATGNNTLAVSTDKVCQGVIQKLINNSGKISPYPVPFQNTLNLNIGTAVVNNASVTIYSLPGGTLVYSKQYTAQSGVLQLDVSGLGNGAYALHLTMENTEKIFKIMKK